ncbi:dCTP deaminase [Exiguobacterium qingdaonense]|uniref:dCTP deaminase n=1 Tax=Exiguobacterium qingdaonense TaxID=2751251 RepID=UPI001BED1812|nr:dCTP deaminase [Exiguobacterium qingdaonense]
MILSKQSIVRALEEGEMQIEPVEAHQIQPASLDLRVGRHFLQVDTSQTERLTLDSTATYVEVEADRMVIPPNTFVLATTMEYVSIPNNMTAFVEGRSSIGRLGLFIQNAGWVDPGFEGRITLELFNANQVPIEIESGRRICQLVFAKLDEATQAYAGKYGGQTTVTASRIEQDIENR